QAVERMKQSLVEKAEEINGIHIVKAVLPIAADAARDLVFKIRESLPTQLLCVIGSMHGEMPLLTVILSDDLVKEHGLNAGQMVREAAKLIQGGGGGQPHFASAGGKNLDDIAAAVEKVIELAK
ncbi:MAG: alanine--tRNA ligase, partial [Prevotella sp.]|nr:alanine--tRNA ligase [Prevotella sp.]